MKENNSITINGNVTINTGSDNTEGRQPIDRTNEIGYIKSHPISV